MPMKSRGRSSRERCGFFSEKISRYLRRLIAAEIIRCTDHFIEHDVDARDGRSGNPAVATYDVRRRRGSAVSSRCRL